MSQSFTRPIPLDYFVEVSKGNVPGVSFISKFGLNPDIDAGTEDVWSQGGTWVPPTAARVHALVSSDAADDNGSTGAYTVVVEGLDSNYALASETVTMDGTNTVNTSGSYVIIHRMYVATAGSGGTNAGNITATAATDATVSCAILIGKGQSQLCAYMIPAGYTGYLCAFGGSCNGGSSANVTLELFAKPFGGVYNLKETLTLSVSGTCQYDRVLAFPQSYAAKTILKMRATSDAANSQVSGEMSIMLVAD